MGIRVPLQPFLRRRRPAKRVMAVSPLTLVSAAYVEATSVTLTFDRAIDIAGIDGSVFLVCDGNSEGFYSGAGGAALVSETTVRLTLAFESDWSEPGVVMNVNAENGIVAAEDAAAWSGVTGLEVPFP